MMKKTELKHYFKTGILSLGIALFVWNCRYQDDSITGEMVREKKIQVISFHDFGNAVADGESFTAISRHFDKDQALDNSPEFSKASENSLILTNKIIRIEKESGASYTFRLLKTGEGHAFYNLVIDVDAHGNIQRSVVFKYMPSDDWLEDRSQPFSGHVSIQNDTVFAADAMTNVQNAAKANACYEVMYEWECNAGNEHAPNTCTAGGSDLVITYFEVPCPESSGGDVAFPVGEGNDPSGPGGGGGASGNNGPNPDSTMTSPMGPDSGSIIDNAFFDDQVFIDDNFKAHPCLKAVYDAMGKATRFSEYLHNFEIEASVADLRFSADDNFGTNPKFGSQYHNAMAITDPPLASNLINITFNTDSELNGNILTKPDVYKAIAMIHEILHAEMYRKMLDAVKAAKINQTNLNWQDWPNDTDFVDFVEALENKYFGIFDYYTRYNWNTATPNNGQHQQMAQHYRDIIKEALTDYDPELTETQKDALSWIGLKDASIVAWQNLSDEEKNTVNNTLSQIKNTFPNGCD